jgi:hypothetical protein
VTGYRLEIHRSIPGKNRDFLFGNIFNPTQSHTGTVSFILGIKRPEVQAVILVVFPVVT